MSVKDPNATDYVVGVVGAGAMGQGIAQVSAMGGMTTYIVDAREGAAAQAKTAIEARLQRLVEKGRLDDAGARAAAERLVPAGAVADLAPCDAVVEAIVEDLEAKRALFKSVEAAVAADALIASNTSSIPIASIAQVCARRDRIAGLHFFNPVPIMKLVEVIRAAETSDAAVAALTALGARFGRTPIAVKDSPGFLVNLGGRAYTTEALRIAHDGVARPEQVDAIMRDCRHFRMGPFELMDLTGIDVNYPVSQIVYDGYMQDPRLRTAPNHKAMADAGLWGRKTGRGWFRYENGAALERPSADFAPDAPAARGVALAEPDPRLEAFCAEIGLALVQDGGQAPILAAPIGEDATSVALRLGVDPKRLVALDLLCDVSKRVTLTTPPGADPAHREAVAAAIVASGRAATLIADGPGFVAQRMAAMVANLGCYMAEIDLAAPDDVDAAMKLGLNYPRGPLELAEDLGARNCLAILERLQSITGDDRYRPTLWLKRRAALGLPIRTPNL